MIPRTVLLYGRSLLLSGVTASLEQSPDVHVTQVATWAEACRLLAGRVPDVLIFELTDASDSRILSLLFKHPELTLLGLDVECNQAILVSGQGTRSLTLDEIKAIVERGESKWRTSLPPLLNPGSSGSGEEVKG